MRQSELQGVLTDLRHINNSLFAPSMGIGDSETDPLSNLDVAERAYHGAQARKLKRNLDVLARILDAPVDHAFMKDYEIRTNFDGSGLGEAMKNRALELGLDDSVREAVKNSRLYPRGGLIHPIIDEYNGSRNRGYTLIPGQIERIIEFTVVPEDYYVFRVQNYNPFKPNFGKINELYLYGYAVHESRFHLIIDELDPFLLRGKPYIDNVLVACYALNIAEWSISNLLLRYRTLLLKYKSIPERQQTEEWRFNFRQLIDDIKMRFTSKSVAAIPNDYDFEYLQTQLTGLKEATSFLYEYLSSVTEIPQSIIRGSARGEIASAKEDKNDYLTMVDSSIRKRKVKPALEFGYDLLLYEKDTDLHELMQNAGIRPHEVDYEIEFPQLRMETEMEQEQREFIQVQRYSMEIDRGISSPAQVEEILYPERQLYEPTEIDEPGNDGQSIDDLLSMFEKNEIAAVNYVKRGSGARKNGQA